MSEDSGARSRRNDADCLRAPATVDGEVVTIYGDNRHHLVRENLRDVGAARR